MSEQVILAYIFLCFSVGLTCLGVTLSKLRGPAAPLARAFLPFFAALSILVLSGLLLAFTRVLPQGVSPTTRAILEYAEAIVGSYSVVFTLPYFLHRLFGLSGWGRDRLTTRSRSSSAFSHRSIVATS